MEVHPVNSRQRIEQAARDHRWLVRYLPISGALIAQRGPHLIRVYFANGNGRVRTATSDSRGGGGRRIDGGVPAVIAFLRQYGDQS
jgi:hypothetical protein